MRFGDFAYRHRYTLALSAIVICGAILRIYALSFPLTLDEYTALTQWVRKGVVAIFTQPQPSSGNHILGALLMLGARSLFGEHEWALRLPSCILGLGAILLIYRAALEFTGNRFVGLLAAFFLAVSPVHASYSAGARGYSAMMFFSLLAGWLLHRSMGGLRARALLGLLAALVLFGMSQLLGLFMIVAWAGAITTQAIKDCAVERRMRPEAVRWLIISIVLGTACVLIIAIHSIDGTLTSWLKYRLMHGEWPSAYATPESPAGWLNITTGRTLSFSNYARYCTGTNNMPATWLLLTLAAMGVARLFRRRFWTGCFLFWSLAGPPLLLWALHQAVVERYVLFLVPYLILALSMGVYSLGEAFSVILTKLRLIHAHRRVITSASASIVLALACSILMIPKLHTNFGHGVASGIATFCYDCRSPAQYIAEHASPGDIVLCYPAKPNKEQDWKNYFSMPMNYYLEQGVFAKLHTARPPIPESISIWYATPKLKLIEKDLFPEKAEFSLQASFFNAFLYKYEIATDDIHYMPLDNGSFAIEQDSNGAPCIAHWASNTFQGKGRISVHQYLDNTLSEAEVMVTQEDPKYGLNWRLRSYRARVEGGKPAMVFAEARTSNGGKPGSILVGLRIYDKEGKPLGGEQLVREPAAPAEAWFPLVKTVLLPAEAAEVDVRVGVVHGKIGETFSFRSVALYAAGGEGHATEAVRSDEKKQWPAFPADAPGLNNQMSEHHQSRYIPK